MNFGGAYMQLDLGQKIRELRRRDGRTQEALAEAIGVTSQAVSRWEANGGYPDMEMIPSIAHYFGISIDELFGYEDERAKKIDELVEKIEFMNFQNNGVDINIDECLALARGALIEFPGNEKLMLCLASVLYNAGYVRYGEYHLIDDDGYDVYDVEQHRTYAEWKEAILLYEKLLKTMEYSENRNQAVHHLTQLYLNIGDHERAREIVATMPSLYNSREFLRSKATDGKKYYYELRSLDLFYAELSETIKANYASGVLKEWNYEPLADLSWLSFLPLILVVVGIVVVTIIACVNTFGKKD